MPILLYYPEPALEASMLIRESIQNRSHLSVNGVVELERVGLVPGNHRGARYQSNSEVWLWDNLDAIPGKWALMYGLDISITGKPWVPMINSSNLYFALEIWE